MANEPWRCIIGDRYILSNCSGDRVTDVGTVDSPYADSLLLTTVGCASPFCSMSLPIVLLSLPGTEMMVIGINDRVKEWICWEQRHNTRLAKCLKYLSRRN